MQDDLEGVKYIVGIDEAGRGPIAGPVSVGIVVLPVAHQEPDTFRDSKKLSEKKRELLLTEMCEQHEVGALRFCTQMSSAEYIDTKGIVPAIKDAMQRGLAQLALDPAECFIYLDGSLAAPKEFRQETVIKGDENIYAIALASIAAKVTRDRHMVMLGEQYPAYGFEKHKGYGTKAHYAAVAESQICPEHRKSFMMKVLGE